MHFSLILDNGRSRISLTLYFVLLIRKKKHLNRNVSTINGRLIVTRKFSSLKMLPMRALFTLSCWLIYITVLLVAFRLLSIKTDWNLTFLFGIFSRFQQQLDFIFWRMNILNCDAKKLRIIYVVSLESLMFFY